MGTKPEITIGTAGCFPSVYMIYLLNEITLCFAIQWKQQNVAHPGAKASSKYNENGHFIKTAREGAWPASAHRRARKKQIS